MAPIVLFIKINCLFVIKHHWIRFCFLAAFGPLTMTGMSGFCPKILKPFFIWNYWNIIIIKVVCLLKTNLLKTQIFPSGYYFHAHFKKLVQRCTILKTALIGDWFSTKIAIWDFFIFKVLFFVHFCYWNLTRLFSLWTEFSETKLRCKSNGSFNTAWQVKKDWNFFLKKCLKNIWKKKWKTFEN